MTGKIKRLCDGFGFVKGADGIDYFVHHSACFGCRFDELREGAAVEFVIVPSPKGPRAETVRLLVEVQ